jgi:two-component system response regulator RegA
MMLDCPTEKSVVIIDAPDSFCVNLGRSFRQLGLQAWMTEDPKDVQVIPEDSRPALIVTELRVGGRWAFDFMEELRALHPDCPIVICTAYPSVASAVRAVRTGFTGYVAKPVAARTILELVDVEVRPEPVRAAESDVTWPSLDRTIWEYINQVYTNAGTMSEAARRLGLDRRSLRRMLGKYPPAR